MRRISAEHAYVQPHSGIDANLVAFWAVLAQRVEGPTLEHAGVRHPAVPGFDPPVGPLTQGLQGGQVPVRLLRSRAA